MKKTLLLLALAALCPALAAPAPASLTYGGPDFKALAGESYRIVGQSGQFTDWLSAAYLKGGVPLADGKTLEEALSRRQAQLNAAKTPAEKDALAKDTAAWAHRFIKKVVPTFSLERGFEFAYLVRNGERQCLLQSTIIAALLQKAGLDSGLVMVWKSMSGQVSNLGHVTSVLRLPSGAGDLQVDASEPDPFATHQGVLAWADGAYRFVKPQFGAGGVIGSYKRQDGQGQVRASDLTFLSLSYVRSQYDYYRAERAIGGVLGTGTGKSTAAGLKTSEQYLRQALALEPHNALAASVLGTVLRKEGREAEARAQYRKAASIYALQGYTPAGMQANLNWAVRGQ